MNEEENPTAEMHTVQVSKPPTGVGAKLTPFYFSANGGSSFRTTAWYVSRRIRGIIHKRILPYG